MTPTGGRWTDSFLDSMRTVADPPADRVVASLFGSGGVAAVNDLMRTLVRNDQLPDQSLPPLVREYLEETAQLPAWADAGLIRHAEDFFLLQGMGLLVMLFHASLPVSYAHADGGVQVVHMTGRLQRDPKRRVGESAQFVVDVLSQGGLAPGGQGIRTAQKVRLMHAAVRHLIGTAPDWNPAWGVPINQEDLAGTLVDFSYVPLKALAKLGRPVPLDDEEAYLHCWKVVGHILGIRPEMLPASMDDAGALVDAIRRRHFRATTEGKEMTAALLELMAVMTPGTVFDAFSPVLIRFLLDDELADALGVPPGGLGPRLLGMLAHVFPSRQTRELPHERALVALLGPFSRQLLSGLMWIERGGDRPPFRMPDALRDQWGMDHPIANPLAAAASGVAAALGLGRR